jgi:hypothetical protein
MAESLHYANKVFEEEIKSEQDKINSLPHKIKYYYFLLGFNHGMKFMGEETERIFKK